jgi:hypothetical protein
VVATPASAAQPHSVRVLPAVTPDAVPDADSARVDSASDAAAARPCSATAATAPEQHGRQSHRMIVGGAIGLLIALLLGALFELIWRRRAGRDDDGADGDRPDRPMPPADVPAGITDAPSRRPADASAGSVGERAIGRPAWDAAETAAPAGAVPHSPERETPACPPGRPVIPAGPTPSSTTRSDPAAVPAGQVGPTLTVAPAPTD